MSSDKRFRDDAEVELFRELYGSQIEELMCWKLLYLRLVVALPASSQKVDAMPRNIRELRLLAVPGLPLVTIPSSIFYHTDFTFIRGEMRRLCETGSSVDWERSVVRYVRAARKAASKQLEDESSHDA